MTEVRVNRANTNIATLSSAPPVDKIRVSRANANIVSMPPNDPWSRALVHIHLQTMRANSWMVTEDTTITLENVMVQRANAYAATYDTGIGLDRLFLKRGNAYLATYDTSEEVNIDRAMLKRGNAYMVTLAGYSGDLYQDVPLDRPLYISGSVPYLDFSEGRSLKVNVVLPGTYTVVIYHDDETVTTQTVNFTMGINTVPAENFNQMVIVYGTLTSCQLIWLRESFADRVVPNNLQGIYAETRVFTLSENIADLVFSDDFFGERGTFQVTGQEAEFISG